ncbi:unnamed protein product [Darwinula stevensoni]|uniref:Apple domain-containing protein n=1 Tax=Darwinula stevensoni TaxID=69355 RepID=A0A7R9FN92_9CRUS|nr:unnamed protein product [Darwinula stevensoni]CAG0896547.1 unnamed protein product [Darwinula stevensoni]
MIVAMANTLTVFTLSCLFWIGSASEPVVYWELHPGERYELVSKEISADFEKCENICAKDDPSLPCKAFNYRESDGTCQLVYKDGVKLVPADDFQAFVKFSCLEEDSKMEKRFLHEQRREKSSLRMHKGEIESLKRFHGRIRRVQVTNQEASREVQRKAPHEEQREAPHDEQREAPHEEQREAPHDEQREAPHEEQRGAPHEEQREAPHNEQRQALQQDLQEPPQENKQKPSKAQHRNNLMKLRTTLGPDLGPCWKW